MCIYCGTTHYRAIYENHYGPIPVEENGRTYHIHHLDGNHSNNDPSNLKAVTIQEHYDIHYSQGDWVACHRLAAILKYSPEEISELAKKNVSEQIQNGKHPWQGGEHQRRLAKRMLENGTHHWLTEDHSKFIKARELKKVENGTHIMLGPNMNKRLLEQGKHISQNKEFQKQFAKTQRENMLKRLESEHWECELCGKQGKGKTNYPRHVNSKACENARKKSI
jgi:ribosomal protein L37AE/L43A